MDRNSETTATNPAAPSRANAAAASGSGTLALVDQSRLRRECLKLALASCESRWRVIDMSNAEDLLRLVRGGQNFDLALIGAATADHVDLDQIRALRETVPDLPIVVVAENHNPHRARVILNAGTRGFLPASLSLKVLLGALDLVMAGGVYVPSSLIDASPARQDWSPAPSQPAEPWSELTRRQRDVLALISQGRSNKLIADALSMSESTVKAHVKQIIKRLRVANRTQAALLATGSGHLVPPPTAAAAEAGMRGIAK